MDFWDRLEMLGNDLSVLRHPFYVRWSEGALSRQDLARYAGQYRHAVVALADASASAAGSAEAGTDAAALGRHAAEEADHVALWDEFVTAVGGDSAAAPTAETQACASTWTGDESRPLLQTLTTLYTIESTQPAISTTKRAGLAKHYGIPSSSYFDLHELRDVEHAAEIREMIERRLTTACGGGARADEDALLETAAGVLRANLELLDGVEAACGR